MSDVSKEAIAHVKSTLKVEFPISGLQDFGAATKSWTYNGTKHIIPATCMLYHEFYYIYIFLLYYGVIVSYHSLVLCINRVHKDSKNLNFEIFNQRSYVFDD